jgi:hypothetical protein
MEHGLPAKLTSEKGSESWLALCSCSWAETWLASSQRHFIRPIPLFQALLIPKLSLNHLDMPVSWQFLFDSPPLKLYTGD